MYKKIIVTGLGFVTKKGYSHQDIWNALCSENEGESFNDCDKYKEIYELDKRFRGLCACANMGVTASKLAWEDNQYFDTSIRKDNWGVYCGTQFGGFTQTQKVQCDALIKYGPLGITPGLSIHSGYHLTADIIAIDYQLTGGNITFSSGKLASGMALLQAFDDIKYDTLEGIAVIGTELVDELILHGYRILSNNSLQNFASGACAVILEASTKTKNTNILGCLKAVAYESYPGIAGGFTFHLYKSLISAIDKSIKDAGIDISDIDAIISTEGNSGIEKLICEKAYSSIFGEVEKEKLVLSITDKLGDTFGANSVMGIGVGLLCLEKQAIPLKNDYIKKRIKNVLVTAIDPSGSAWASIISKE